MARGKLTDEIRTFIVHGLACFDTPSTVSAAVKREFQIDASPQSVETYDPTKRAGRNLSERWTTIFNATREEFLKDTSRIGISHRSVRLRSLERMAAKAEEMRNLQLAAQLLEQAAKEVGDAYTNRHKHEVTGKDGAPVQVQSFDLTKLTDEQLAAYHTLSAASGGN